MCAWRLIAIRSTSRNSDRDHHRITLSTRKNQRLLLVCVVQSPGVEVMTMWILILRSHVTRDYFLCETKERVDGWALSEKLRQANLLPPDYWLDSCSTSERRDYLPRYASVRYDDRPAPMLPHAFRADRFSLLKPLLQP